jgi:hypothetical protein
MNEANDELAFPTDLWSLHTFSPSIVWSCYGPRCPLNLPESDLAISGFGVTEWLYQPMIKPQIGQRDAQPA